MATQLDLTRWILPAALAGAALLLGLLAGYDPRFAIAAALAFAFVVLVFLDLAAGLAVFGFLTFVEVASPGSSLSAVKLGGLVLALAWLALITTRGNAKLELFSVHRGLTLLLIGLVAWTALSAVWATDTGETLTAASRFLLNIVLFAIVFTAVRSRRDAGMVTAAFIAGAIVAVLYGLLGPQNEAFVQGYEGRLSGGVLDPNQLAASLVPGAILALAGASMARHSPAWRVVAIVALLACLIGVMLTVSRGGLIALGVASVAGIVLAGPRRLQVTLLVVFTALFGVFYFSLFAPEEAKERITSSTQGQVQIEEGRTTIWQVAWRAFEDNPTTGVGAGNFPVVSREYVLEPGTLARTDEIIDSPAVAHNTYLEILAELGIPGLLLFGGIVAFSLVSAVRASHLFSRAGDRGMHALSLGLAVGLVGALTADFFIAEEYSKQLWLLLGLGPALLAIARSGAPQEPSSSS